MTHSLTYPQIVAFGRPVQATDAELDQIDRQIRSLDKKIHAIEDRLEIRPDAALQSEYVSLVKQIVEKTAEIEAKDRQVFIKIEVDRWMPLHALARASDSPFPDEPRKKCPSDLLISTLVAAGVAAAIIFPAFQKT